MLGVLLARAGIETVVLEKHKDFLRDFRGDTIHPSTLQLMQELGWLQEFLQLPHQKVSHLSGQVGVTRLAFADFSHLPVAAPYVAMMPQWDFLNFLAEKGHAYPGFKLLMQHSATGLLRNGDQVRGLTAEDDTGAPLAIEADLVVAADGRHSTLRQASGLAIEDLGAPMDVLWFRLPRETSDSDETLGRFDRGRLLVMINRGDYWQCAYVIPKGNNAIVRAAGLAAFRDALRPLLSVPAERADALVDWDQVKLLEVQVNRLKQWWLPGFLCIGDAAHAMSPVGGVGINLAVQDAVATANRLAGPLKIGSVVPGDLAAVQKRREWPTRVTQRLQVLVQNRIIAPTLAAPLSTEAANFKAPFVVRMLLSIPFVRRIPARLVGLGIRPEHIETPAAA
jgi:2-polyprenyl-6-methoxyphenol hydroxylase-like FAD-dependent oxidoreductase